MTAYSKGKKIAYICPSGHTFTGEVFKDCGDFVKIRELTQSGKAIKYLIKKSNIIEQ